MKRNVSPAFAVAVVVFALIVGALYFLHQYNKNEALVAAEKQGLQQRANAAMKSGRMADKEEQMAARRAGNAPGATRAPAAEAPKSGKAPAAGAPKSEKAAATTAKGK